MLKYIALLRGINVGGRNIIKMHDLKSSFERNGFSNVTTYIQSGNVIFYSPLIDLEKIETQLEKILSSDFSYDSTVVVITAAALIEIVNKAPKDFGATQDKYKYDVLFLKHPLSPDNALERIPIKEGVDNVYKGRQVIYFSRLISQLTKSKLSQIAKSEVYPYITIRNWNTTTKLRSLIE